MYKFTTLLLFCCLVVLSNCTSKKSNAEDTEIQESAEATQAVAPENTEPPASLSTPVEAENQETANQAASNDEPAANSKDIDHPIRPGKHNFTLQWISWDNPGTVRVEFLAENKYQVKGEQKGAENGDFASIDGVLTFVGEQTFQFDGELVSRVSFLNGGETCVKKGPLHFRATGKRKYWRLQEKDNCEEGDAVDYFDIYF